MRQYIQLFAMNTSHQEWEELYSSFPARALPWESGKPSPTLVNFVTNGTIRGSVLDSGCGAGRHAVWMAQHGLTVSGIDISETAIVLARSRATDRSVDVDFRVGDTAHVPFPNTTFDAVFDRGTYHHQGRHKAAYVQEMTRVLKSHGKYLLLAFSPAMHWPKSVSAAEVEQMFGSTFTIDWIGKEVHLQPNGLRVKLIAILMTKQHGRPF